MFFATKMFLLLACSLVIAMAAPNTANRPMPGGVIDLKGEELKQAEAELQNSLDKLAAGDGPEYTISKVNSATRQIVGGTLTNFDVDLIDENHQVKNCKVTIWALPLVVDGVEVTFDCVGEQKVVKKHSA